MENHQETQTHPEACASGQLSESEQSSKSLNWPYRTGTSMSQPTWQGHCCSRQCPRSEPSNSLGGRGSSGDLRRGSGTFPERTGGKYSWPLNNPGWGAQPPHGGKSPYDPGSWPHPRFHMRGFQPTGDSVEPTTENNLGRVNPPSSNLSCSRGPCTQDHGP